MFSFDNPGGEWLAGKRARAEEGMARRCRGPSAHGLLGAVTAWTRMAVMADVAVLAALPGANGEARGPGDPQYDDLAGSVRAGGWLDDQMGNAVLIGVNHLGDACIIEGNTRVAMARDLGVEMIRTEIRWFNGAESAPGQFRIEPSGELPFCRPFREPDDEEPSPFG